MSGSTKLCLNASKNSTKIKTKNLSTEQKTLLEKEYKGFARNGALLNDDKKRAFAEIDTEKAQLSLTFGENVLADTHAFELHITEEKDLEGLPDQIKEMAVEMAQSKNKTGWVFTLDYPSYVPFMTYAENRELRTKMSLAFGRRGFQDNNHNNTAIILRLIELRKKEPNCWVTNPMLLLYWRNAWLLPKNVINFLEDLYQKAHLAAQGEWKMEEFAAQNLGLNTLEKWDTAYVSEKTQTSETGIRRTAT